MKYRCLSDEELKELEGEFKHFLISNNFYTEEWEELNKKKDKKVQELVEMFSDIVLDKALKNIRFLEHITQHDIKSFKCDEPPNQPILILSDFSTLLTNCFSSGSILLGKTTIFLLNFFISLANNGVVVDT